MPFHPFTAPIRIDVTNISRHGFWILLQDEELFLPFAEFPWFRDAPVGKILNLELPSPDHLYWPDWMGTWPWNRSDIRSASRW